MSLQNTKEILKYCFSAKICPFLLGPPGIGKSQIVRELAAEQGREIIDLRLSLLNPVDLRGIPVAKDGVTSWMAPSFLPRGDSNAILFLDEINSAPPAVQSAAYQLILDRRCGEYILPQNVDIVAAGNRTQDKALVYEMSSALKNRMMILEVSADIDSWKTWATKNNISDRVISFLSFRPEYLHKFDSTFSGNFPSPRSWERVSKILDIVPPDFSGMHPMVAGLVGEGVAVEFLAFLRLYHQIPDAEDVLAGKPVKMPMEPSARYAFSGSLVSALIRAKHFVDAAKCVFAFLASTDAEFAVLTAKDIVRTEQFKKNSGKLISSGEWKKFCTAFGSDILG